MSSMPAFAMARVSLFRTLTLVELEVYHQMLEQPRFNIGASEQFSAL